MEQHKVLLIIVSVAIVLAAVVGVGLWLFYPRSADDVALEQNGTPESGGYEWQPLDFLQGQGEVPGLDEGGSDGMGDPDEFQVTYGVVPGATAPETSDQPAAGGPTVIQATPLETTDVPGPGTRPVSADATATTMAGTATAAADDTETAGTSVTTATGTSPQAASPSTTPSSSASRPAATDLADQAYWVQAISSPNRDTVEQAWLTLREHQLGSRILTKVIDDQTYYRLRVGPFAVRAEAEKFLGWVQAIDDFADAMIFVDYTTPVLAAR